MLRLLKFLCLVESDERVSLTNAAMWIALGKLAFLRSYSLTEMTALLAMLGAYAFKAHRRSRGITSTHELKVKELTDAVEGIKTKLQKTDVREALAKMPLPKI